MQAIGRQPQRAPDGASVHYERHRPEQTTLYRLVQQHAATFFAQAEDAAASKGRFKRFGRCVPPLFRRWFAVFGVQSERKMGV